MIQRSPPLVRKSPVEDSELAALALAGDREAFGELVTRYAGQARRVARAILHDPADADDAAQDGFLAALRRLARYDPTRPFGPWLLRIVGNAAIDKRRRRRVRVVEQLSPALRSTEPAPSAVAERSAFWRAVEDALRQLPERQRLAVTLYDVEGYTHREIADILNIPVGTVRSDVFHGRRSLRAQLAPWKDAMEETT